MTALPTFSQSGRAQPSHQPKPQSIQHGQLVGKQRWLLIASSPVTVATIQRWVGPVAGLALGP